MTFVADKSDLGIKVDRRYESPNRKTTANPIGALLPGYAGEIVTWYDSGTSVTRTYKANGLTNTDWVELYPTGTIY